MKGLLLSLVVFVLYVISTAVVSHIGRFERHSRLFLPAIAIWTPVYFALYALTSPSLGFLSEPWMATHRLADAIYGYGVLLLNVHSYIDWFFGFNGGFSTSVMLKLLRAGKHGLASHEVLAHYRLPDGTDKIFGWRVPRLVETGYLQLDGATGRYTLTKKGLLAARIGYACKRFLNLGKGG